MINRSFSCLFVVCMGLAFCVSTGCDSDLFAPSTVNVSGRITFDGQPLVDADVLLIPLNAIDVRNRFSSVSGGKTGQDGGYSLKTPDGRIGAARGMHLVLVSKRKEAVSPSVETAKLGLDDSEVPLQPIAGADRENVLQHVAAPWMTVGHSDENEIVPAHYNRESILTAIIGKNGNTKLDFDLDTVDPWARESQSVDQQQPN